MQLEVDVRTVDGVTVVDVAGDVEIEAAHLLREQLADAAAAAPGERPLLVINLSRVHFIDSTGLAVLVHVRRVLADRAGTVHLVCAENPVVRSALTVTGLSRIFPMHATVGKALDGG